MNSKFGTVKNPLTIIAIFAGIAEVSGTAILPFLQNQSQSLYVWFLMILPILIVILFFITLNWNHKVLYAPSDFKNEDNFVGILQKASTRDMLSQTVKEADELAVSGQDVESTDTSGTTEKGEEQGIPEVTSVNSTNEEISVNDIFDRLELAKERIPTKDIRQERNVIRVTLQRKIREEIEIAEKLAVEKLGKELGVPIETGVQLNLGKGKHIFDGVIRQNNKLTVVDVKFLRDLQSSSSIIFTKESIEDYRYIYDNLSDQQKMDFSLIYVIVTDEIVDESIRKFDLEWKKMLFPVVIKCYEFDKLVDELIIKGE